MEPEYKGQRPQCFVPGDNALSPLVARELAVLLWSLMEDTEGTHLDALLTGWRQLAREERWWLYARASNPAQRQGQGWRLALFFALTDPADTHSAPRLLQIAEAATVQKKKALVFAARQSSGGARQETNETISAEKGEAEKDETASPAGNSEGRENATTEGKRHIDTQSKTLAKARQLELF